MAVMLRSVGIPARLATGFLATEYNSLTGWWVLRSANAHSWVEAWIPGRGWQSYDPTPPSREISQAPFFSQIRFWQDAMDTFWHDWVLSYDLRRQLTLALSVDKLRTRAQAALEAGAGAAKSTVDMVAAHVWSTVSLAVVLLGVTLTTVFWWKRRRKRRQVRRLLNDSANEAQRLYARLVDLLERRGIRKPAWQTAGEFANSLPQPRLREKLTEFNSAYLAVRFGGDRSEIWKMQSCLAEIESEASSGWS
jgi:hypothetical protein